MADEIILLAFVKTNAAHKTNDRSLGRFLSRGSSSAWSPHPFSSSSEGPEPPEDRGRLGLTTIYESNKSSQTQPLVDIVFIHGLGGNSVKTWSYSSDPQSF